jgi:hypothetical protein
VLPPRTINAEQEDEIVKMLELEQRQRLEQDPMRELDEALMDRTTASQNRRKQIMHIKSTSDSKSPTSVKSIEHISPPDLPIKRSFSKGTAQIADDILSSNKSSSSSQQKKRIKKQKAKKA